VFEAELGQVSSASQAPAHLLSVMKQPSPPT
jgi:hypothetical protein